MIPPILVRKLGFTLLGKLFRRFGGVLWGKYRPAMIGAVGVALVAAGGFAWWKWQNLKQAEARAAVLEQALETNRQTLQRLLQQRETEQILLAQHRDRAAKLQAHADELLAELRKVPTDACIDQRVPSAALDLLRR